VRFSPRADRHPMPYDQGQSGRAGQGRPKAAVQRARSPTMYRKPFVVRALARSSGAEAPTTNLVHKDLTGLRDLRLFPVNSL
jgi:hypothetical protein